MLPLTQEIGDAIVTYIKDGRPQTDAEALFIRSRAPFRALDKLIDLLKAPLLCGVKRPRDDRGLRP